MAFHVRTSLLALAATAALVAGCTAGDDGSSSDTTAGAEASSTATVASGPAPGVTDDSVKVGVTYVDLEAIADVVDISHGDYEKAFSALLDDINAEGGINGRTIDYLFAPINPVGTAGAEEACARLTQDEQVFVAMGFFLDDAPLCYVDTHQTAVIGGNQTTERLARARAPWYTIEPGSDSTSDAIRAFDDAGELGGTLGVFAGPGQEAEMNDVVLALLDELGVDVAEHAVVDAPADDINAVNAATQVIVERFRSAGVDQVLIVGDSGLTWATGAESTDFRPQLLFSNSNSILAFAGDAAAHDLSVLDGAVAANLYGGPANTYDLPAMQDCIAIIRDAGGTVDDPADLPPDTDRSTWTSVFSACNDVALLRALLEAAGPDLNYGSLVAGSDGLEVQLPGDPEPDTYGPPPAADGDRRVYVYDWDPDQSTFVIRED